MIKAILKHKCVLLLLLVINNFVSAKDNLQVIHVFVALCDNNVKKYKGTKNVP